MTNVMLIDGNSIGFASHQSTKLTYNNEPVQAIFGFIKTLKRLKERFRDYEPIILWDGESWRYQLYSDYKGNRKDPKTELMKIEYKKQIPAIKEAIKLLGIKQVCVSNYEADDLGYIFATKLVAAGNKIILITGDKDWLQMVQPGVMWYDPIRDRKCNYLDFVDFTGCDSIQGFIDKKCLMGDTSDNIKGVGGIGETRALDLVQVYGTVQCFLERDFSEEEINAMPKYLRDFKLNTNKGIDKYYENVKLMALNTDSRPKPVNKQIINGELNFDRFEEFCFEHGFSSIRLELNSYKNLFGAN